MKLSHHGLKTSNTAKFLKDISTTFSFAGNSGHQGYSGASRLRYLRTHSSRVNASRYGMVYLMGDEGRNIIYDFSDKRITVREGSVKSKALKGWVTVKGGYSQYWKTDKYYIDSRTGKPVKGYFNKGGKHFYMGSGGCMEKAFYGVGGKYQYWRNYNGGKSVRYYTKSGRFYKGIKQVGRYTYLFTGRGYRETGIEKVKGKYYYFDRAGKMAKNKTVKIAGHKLKASKSGVIRAPIPSRIKAMAK
jgi:glucan-binding YG repeat protein